MISKKGDLFLDLKNVLSKEAKAAREIKVLSEQNKKEENKEHRDFIESQLRNLKGEIKKSNGAVKEILEKINPPNSFGNYRTNLDFKKVEGDNIGKGGFLDGISNSQKKPRVSDFEMDTLNRLKGTEKKEFADGKKLAKPNPYVSIANQLFSDISTSLASKNRFRNIQEDLVKANLNFLLRSYISVTILTTTISFFFAILIFIFLLFFNISAQIPFVTASLEPVLTRIIKTIWVIAVLPLSVFTLMYFYPSLERDSVAKKVEVELPFATINMAAISGSMIDPTKIFTIMISTREYPNLEKEFTKLLNSVNILGYDLVTALRDSTGNTASKRLAELFNGLATTITSGGDLPRFFQERAQSMLFDYNLEKEKSTKTAETFMDIYISVVVAAPMILMLLLMMMRISGLGLALSTGMITLIMILSVIGINIAFLTFLHIKQSSI